MYMIICTMYSDLCAFNSKLINSIDLITVAIAESSFWILDINILYWDAQRGLKPLFFKFDSFSKFLRE